MAQKILGKDREGFTPIADLLPLGDDLPNYSAFKKQKQPSKEPRPELTRSERSTKNKRGRVNPSKVPAKLTRTSAFLPQSNNLNTDRNFEKVYVVPGYSVLRISGGELGYQHRDALYTLFRLTPSLNIPEEYRRQLTGALRHNEVYLCAQSTWRELLDLSGVSPHVNTILTLKKLLQDFQHTLIEEVIGDPEVILEKQKKGRLGGPGSSLPVITGIFWGGDGLNDKIAVVYGESVQKAFRDRYLVSLDHEVQRELKTGYGKSIWPFIDGQPNYTYLPEDTITALIGVNIWEDQTLPTGKVLKAYNIRADFRKKCRKAFQDMQEKGGLASWNIVKERKRGKTLHTYHYIHGKTRQLELGLSYEN